MERRLIITTGFQNQYDHLQISTKDHTDWSEDETTQDNNIIFYPRPWRNYQSSHQVSFVEGVESPLGHFNHYTVQSKRPTASHCSGKRAQPQQPEVEECKEDSCLQHNLEISNSFISSDNHFLYPLLPSTIGPYEKLRPFHPSSDVFLKTVAAGERFFPV